MWISPKCFRSKGDRKELNHVLRIMAIEQDRELLVVLLLWYQRRLYGVYEPGRSVELGSVSRPLLDYCWLIINDEHSVNPKRYVLRISLRVSSTEISRASS